MNAVVDFPVKREARDYLACFARDESEPDWLARSRQQAMTRFAELGFPSRKSEAWRYLDLRSLEERPLLPRRPAGTSVEGALSERVASLSLSPAAKRLVLLDGRFSPGRSAIEPTAGIWFGAMARALGERTDLLRAAVEQTVGDAAHPFAALNAAFFADGYVLDIAPGVVGETPIEIVHFASTGGSAHTRSLINLGAGSRATIIETFAGECRYWRNDVVAVRLAEGAELHRIVIVAEAPEAVHLAQVDAELAKEARLSGFALLLGGHRVRQEWNVRLAGEGARCRLDGAYLVAGGDEANIVTAVDHAAPGGQTSELIKGVAAGRGHGAFQGRIIVREGAQQTDAHQLSRNLVIGTRAAIDTKPELEIYADDVKCSHGASVGDLDEAALFYLRSRGIPEDEARHMLIEGFLREAIEQVDDGLVREHLQQRLAAGLGRLEM